MKSIPLYKAKKVAEQLKVNLNIVPLKIWKKGMDVELEHGRIYLPTNVTNDDLVKTGKIVLAHLLEDIFYYERLEKLEEEAKKFWKNKKMPSPLL